MGVTVTVEAVVTVVVVVTRGVAAVTVLVVVEVGAERTIVERVIPKQEQALL